MGNWESDGVNGTHPPTHAHTHTYILLVLSFQVLNFHLGHPLILLHPLKSILTKFQHNTVIIFLGSQPKLGSM